MQINLTTGTGKASKTGVDVADAAFGIAFNEALVHQVVTAYMAGARAGTRAQKTRAEVRGGGAKPWRQKGMGRARAGSIRSPIWRGGGVTFAAQPRSFVQKVNRKMYRGAMRCIVSELVRQERLLVVETFAAKQAKTRELVQRLTKLKLHDVLIVTAEADENLELSARNLHHVGVLTSESLSPVTLLAFDKVLITVPALKQLEGRLA